MAKKSRVSTSSDLDTLAELLRGGDGRVPVTEVCALLKITRAHVNDLARPGVCAIGQEDGREFVVSAAKELRLQVIASYLSRNPGKRTPHVELKKLIGVPEHSTILRKIVPDDHPSIRRDQGDYWWVADKSDPQRIESVAIAARCLLYRSGFDDYLKHCSDRVRLKLRRIWDRNNLTVAIDGGRTNLEVAREVAKQRLPVESVRMVTYLTNYKPIEQAIFDRRETNLHDPVLIGGRLRDHSKTYVGRFAEACWHSYSITPDIAFVATSTVSERGSFATSDFEESRFKSLLLGGADTTLRCITADSSKILARKGGGWTFASLENVDVVVTDRRIWAEGEPFVKDARAFGVLVVTELSGISVGDHV